MTTTLRFTGTSGHWLAVGACDDDVQATIHLAKRARTRMSGLHPEAVQLVAVADVDTAHLARRGRWTCTCNRPRNAEHALGCAWWRNDWTRAYPQHPGNCPDCGRQWPRT